MAPTEILAQQHYFSARQILEEPDTGSFAHGLARQDRKRAVPATSRRGTLSSSSELMH